MFQTFCINAFELLHGNQSNPAFRDTVYAAAGVWLLALTILAAAFFYYVLNTFWARYAKVSVWLVVAFCSIILNDAAVLYVEHTVPDLPLGSSASVSLLMIDALYAFLAYVIASYLFKWFSRNARHTPF